VTAAAAVKALRSLELRATAGEAALIARKAIAWTDAI
jgi:hypothetical protein